MAEELLASLPVAVRILSLRGELEYLNPAALAAVEQDRSAESVGASWPALWPAETAPAIEQAMRSAAQGEPHSLRAVQCSRAGARRWWDTTVSPMRDAGGEIHKLLAVSIDVTRSVEAEAFFNTIIQLLPTPLLVKTASDGRYVLINRAAEETFGLSGAVALGKTAFELFPQEEALLFAAEDADVIRSGETRVSEEEPITTRDSGVRYFTTKKFATYEEDRPLHLVAIGEDVTDKRAAATALKLAAAQAEAATQAKSAFLANMSHEIRTPLNGVVGVADLLARTSLTGEQIELVDIIRSCGDTLNRMLMDVLDLSKIEAGKFTLSAEAFNLAELVRSVSGLMRPTAHAKGLTFSCDIDAAAQRSVLGDPIRLRQIITNLLSNAIKFTESGSVGLCVRSVAPDRYQVEVQDTGIGFDEEVRQQLFERFQQADGTINRRFGGTGLGLAISRQLASLMDGELDAASVPGQGSRFTLTVPLASAEATAATEAGPGRLDARPTLRLSVLAVDDHAINRKIVQMSLEAAGAKVYLARDGEEAVRLFREGRFDLVFMDMQMPGLDGVAATREIRRIETERRAPRTQVVMLTANASDQHVAQALAAGADAHLAKPLKPDALLSIILQLKADIPPDIALEA
ncbi:PAS domain-containing sensor histidine kinase [Phenylobacterium hankyongense]|uniref:PAS domain-containing sensor histidine kinase n=1 Tax=Phenylobacterium hankyongense TaxID=1813876 RepID=UPI00140373F1|nr:PAS domain-containing sensor histidine kinase [Phenylobacterium hankyongense]